MSCQLPGCFKQVHPGSLYCSISHRDHAGQATCQFPGCSKPIYPGSSYCSRSHRDNAPSHAGRHNNAAGQATCQFLGCSKPVYPGSPYCSRSHRDNAPSQGGGGPGPSPQVQVTTLHPLAQTDSKYQGVLQQFESKWLHTTNSPPVVVIYRILLPNHIFNAYKSYRASVEARGSFKAIGKTEGNECRRFHGTKRACSLGDHGSTTLCTSAQCSLCSILTIGFKLNLAGSNKPWRGVSVGRLGRGLYSSSTSSKSDYYSTNLGMSQTKAMLLAKVVVGKTQKLHGENTTLTQAPPGFDSIIGEPDQHHFNYDELVVYKEEAIIPAYLIIYTP